jgi:hypothetical protein
MFGAPRVEVYNKDEVEKAHIKDIDSVEEGRLPATKQLDFVLGLGGAAPKLAIRWLDLFFL